MRRLKPAVERQAAEMKKAAQTRLFGERLPYLTKQEREALKRRQLAEIQSLYTAREHSEVNVRPAHYWRW